MVVSEDGAQPSCAATQVQPGCIRLIGKTVWLLRRGMGPVLAASLLAGCSSTSSMNPINWWHRQEGGKIAEERPDPPGADQPYPNLNTVPGRPTPPDQKTLDSLTAALIADRTNAQHAAQAAPIADPSSPSQSPALFGVGTTPPPPPASAATTPAAVGTPPAGAPPSAAASPAQPPMASASMPAVTTPPPPPATAPRKAVQSTPLDAPTAPSGASPAPAGDATAATAPPAAPADFAPPDLPAAPPPVPAVAGVLPPPPVVPAPMPSAGAGPNATIVFTEGSASLSAPATDEVKAFAGKRATGTIVVTGYGDASSSNPAAQSAAVTLGLSRAQAVVDALKQAGVPGNAIRVSAEASGRGASLLLLQ